MEIEITEDNYKDASIEIINQIFNQYIEIVKHIYNTRKDIYNTFEIKWKCTDSNEMKLQINVLQNGKYLIEEFEYTLNKTYVPKYVLPKLEVGKVLYLHKYTYTSNGDSFSEGYYLKDKIEHDQSTFSITKCYINSNDMRNYKNMCMREKFENYVLKKFKEKIKQHNDILYVRSHIYIYIPEVWNIRKTYGGNKIKLLATDRWQDQDIDGFNIHIHIKFSFKQKVPKENTIVRLLK